MVIKEANGPCHMMRHDVQKYATSMPFLVMKEIYANERRCRSRIRPNIENKILEGNRDHLMRDRTGMCVSERGQRK